MKSVAQRKLQRGAYCQVLTDLLQKQIEVINLSTNNLVKLMSNSGERLILYVIVVFYTQKLNNRLDELHPK